MQIMAALGALLVGWFISDFVPTVHAQTPSVTEKIFIEVVGAVERDAAVTGEFRIPGSNLSRFPAVLIVNSTPGFDGRGLFYAEVLNQSGFATLEVDIYQGKGMPVTNRHSLPHVFQSLR